MVTYYIQWTKYSLSTDSLNGVKKLWKVSNAIGRTTFRPSQKQNVVAGDRLPYEQRGITKEHLSTLLNNILYRFEETNRYSLQN